MASAKVGYTEAALQRNDALGCTTATITTASTTVVTQQQQQLAVSLQQIYVTACNALGCKTNSYLLKTLTSVPGDFQSLQTLDLSLNFVGRLGIRAVLSVVRVAGNLRWISFADNWLNNDAVKELTDVLKDHRGVQYLDLSRNPISHVAGRLLADYASCNSCIHHIILDGTLIGAALLRMIQNRTKANRDASGATLNATKSSPVPSVVVHLPAPAAVGVTSAASPITTPSNKLNERWESKSTFVSLLRQAATQLDPNLDVSMMSSTAASEPTTQASAVGAEVSSPTPNAILANEPININLPPVENEKDACITRGVEATLGSSELTVSTTTCTTLAASPTSASADGLNCLGTVFQVIQKEDKSHDFVGMALLCSIAREATPEGGRLPLLLKDPPEVAILGDPSEGALMDEDGLHGISCAEDFAQQMAAKFQQQPTVAATAIVTTASPTLVPATPDAVSPSTSNGSTADNVRDREGICLLCDASRGHLSTLPGVRLLCQLCQVSDAHRHPRLPVRNSHHHDPWYGMKLLSILLHQAQGQLPAPEFTQQWQVLPEMVNMLFSSVVVHNDL